MSFNATGLRFRLWWGRCNAKQESALDTPCDTLSVAVSAVQQTATQCLRPSTPQQGQIGQGFGKLPPGVSKQTKVNSTPNFLNMRGSKIMRRSRFPNPTRMIFGVLTGLMFTILVVPLIAQTADDSCVCYDVTKEVTLSGTVSGVLTKPTAGMIMGSHLLLATVSGAVDASLGRWGLQGEGALAVTVGQQVEMTGVMRVLKNREVFLARTVKVGGKVYPIRNEHGIPVSPQTRKRAAEKGESL
jgi:hypothetical protein